MARTTADEVKAILGFDYDTVNNPGLTAYIATASSLIDDVSTCATLKGLTVTTEKLTLLETWVAAWAYQQSDKGYLEKWTEKAKAVYQTTSGKGLESNSYGQTALTLDTTGCLSALSSKARASALWLGRNPTDQTEYADRR